MAALPLRLWLVLLICVWTSTVQCKAFTNEDLRDNLMSIMHVVRRSEEKLERHEYRSKAVGETLKRMVTAMGKHYLEPLKGVVSRLDERLSNVETILLNKEERERGAQKKMNEALEGIKKSIQTLTTAVEGMKANKEIDNNLTTNEDSVDRRLATTDTKIDEVKIQIEGLKKEFNKDALRAMCLNVATDMNPFAKHISDAEKLLTRYDLKLNEFNSTRIPTDIVQLNDVAMADEAWHSKMHEEMQNQGKEINKIQKLLTDAEGVWKQLPTLVDLQTGTNQTLDAIANNTERMNEISEAGVSKVTGKMRELSDRLQTTNEDIQRSLTQGNTLAEQSFGDILGGFSALRTEMQSLMKMEKVMLQTGDNVIANKRRIEYGVQQILMQVNDLVFKLASTVNVTVAERMNRVEASIMGNQALSHMNLSSKLDTEVAAVWRQIGIMHDQLKANKAVLDKLTELSNDYVNTSSTTLDKVKAEVDSISKRMLGLSDDFNYALGRIGLVTQEFSQISTGLADAITSLKKDVQAAQKPVDAGPGPHTIPSDEKTP